MFQKGGTITYNGQKFDDFFVRRASAYISQTDNHIAELTVRETLDFAARCQGSSEGFSGMCFVLFFQCIFPELICFSYITSTQLDPTPVDVFVLFLCDLLESITSLILSY